MFRNGQSHRERAYPPSPQPSHWPLPAPAVPQTTPSPAPPALSTAAPSAPKATLSPTTPPSLAETPSASPAAPPADHSVIDTKLSPAETPSVSPAAPPTTPPSPPSPPGPTAGAPSTVAPTPSTSPSAPAPAASAETPTAPSPPPMPAEAAMSDANRRQIQETLHRLGYYQGPVDGIFGPLSAHIYSPLPAGHRDQADRVARGRQGQPSGHNSINRLPGALFRAGTDEVASRRYRNLTEPAVATARAALHPICCGEAGTPRSLCAPAPAHRGCGATNSRPAARPRSRSMPGRIASCLCGAYGDVTGAACQSCSSRITAYGHATPISPSHRPRR